MHRARHAQNVHGVHAVRFYEVTGRGLNLVGIRLNDGDSSMRLSVRERVDEDGCFVSILQPIREVESTNTEVDNANFRGQIAIRESVHDFNTEAIISQEDVADSCDQDARLYQRGYRSLFAFRQWFDFRGTEEETMLRLAHLAEIASGILLKHDANVLLPLVILLKAVDRRDLPA